MLRHTHHPPLSTHHHTRHDQRRRTIFRSAARVLWLTLGMCLGGLLWASTFQLPAHDTHSTARPFTFVMNADTHERGGRGEGEGGGKELNGEGEVTEWTPLPRLSVVSRVIRASVRRKRPPSTPASLPPRYTPTAHDVHGHDLFGIPLDPVQPVYLPPPESSSESASAVGAAAAASAFTVLPSPPKAASVKRSASSSPPPPPSSSSSSKVASAEASLSLPAALSAGTGAPKHTRRKRGMLWPFGGSSSSTTTTTTRPNHGGVRQSEAVTAADAVDIDFTLVTIASADRLWLVSHICKRWTGPIIVAVTTHGMAADRQAHMRGLYTTECPGVRMELIEHVPGWTEEMWADPNKFPINILRNHAISLVNTTHYVMADVDFWPNHGLYTHLRRISSGGGAIGGGGGAQGQSSSSIGGGGSGGAVQSIAGSSGGGGETNTPHTHTDPDRRTLLRHRHTTTTSDNVSSPFSTGDSGSSSSSSGESGESGAESARALFVDPFSAFVVPAFELQTSKHATKPGSPRDMPKDVQDLEACLKSKKCHVFQSVIAPRGHATTHSDEWIRIRHTTRPYAVRCFESNMYEPYLVLRKGHPTPAYAEAFTGYGKNKIQHIVHLRHRGFSFHILPQAFLVHFPHKTSDAYKSWYESRHVEGHRKNMTRMYDRFIEWAEQEDAAKGGSVVPLCEQTADNPTRTAKPLASESSASTLPSAVVRQSAAPGAHEGAALEAAAVTSRGRSSPPLPSEAAAAAVAAAADAAADNRASALQPPPAAAVRAPAHTTAAPPPALRPPSSTTSNAHTAHTISAERPPGGIVAVE